MHLPRYEEYNNWAYASQISKVSTSSQLSDTSQLSKKFSSRSFQRRNKDKKQYEGVEVISNTLLSTPV